MQRLSLLGHVERMTDDIIIVIIIIIIIIILIPTEIFLHCICRTTSNFAYFRCV
jgi:hypothetical protein